MIVSIIVAVGKNYEIGKDNDLIWDLPADMAHFMRTTKGHYVIMGRRNYDSIPEKYRPLKGRPNIVVTRREGLILDGCAVVNSIEDGIQIARNNGESECFIIGGGQIYKEALLHELVDRMYITHIDAAFDADTFFPDFESEKWTVSTLFTLTADDKNAHNFIVSVYDKK